MGADRIHPRGLAPPLPEPSALRSSLEGEPASEAADDAGDSSFDEGEVPTVLAEIPEHASSGATFSTSIEELLEISTLEMLQPEPDASVAQAEGEAPAPAPVPVAPAPAVPLIVSVGRHRGELLSAVRAAPLDGTKYEALAEDFAQSKDMRRAELMFELARALSGADEGKEPPVPQLILSATDRAGLRHPALRGEPGELLGLAGLLLCQMFPLAAAASAVRDELRLNSGKGAPHVAEALLASVRILGLRAPDVFISDTQSVPMTLSPSPEGMRILVAKAAVKRRYPPAALRFFAGRALFTQSPDLFALRHLSREQLAYGLAALTHLSSGGRPPPALAHLDFEGAVSPKARPRLLELLRGHAKTLPSATLIEAARHSVNRAGLVVCGGVGPALRALREKRALEAEIVELVRFAASERFLGLRERGRFSPAGGGA